MRSHALTILAPSGATCLSGCVAAAAVGAAGVGMFAAQERTIGEGIDDSVAYSAIRSRLLAADASGFGGVDVEVSEGLVLLSGAAPDAEHVTTAETIARGVGSVRAVYNEIIVGPPNSISENANDDWISAQVRARFVASPDVRAININIRTFQGTIYLMGLTRSQSELQRAAEIASHVKGAVRVVCMLRVRASDDQTAPAWPQPDPQMRADIGS